MDKKWKFVKEKDLLLERVLGRVHYWHSHPEIIENGSTYLVKVVMPKGGCHDFHIHPEMNEILYILKGTAEQWIENEMEILKEGDSVFLDQNIAHATFNVGDDDLEFLAMLSPVDGWAAGTVDVSEDLPYSEYRKHK
ncbi:cupin domain-containing protein [Cellulophaga sp. F20128]|uniref:cupin domain-containing protein n=1 Tax=Cellulophaga sp. F20128 TaxID=2926413 RepID=UPI001FF511C3|nr:cupin domain-containing protein [Cellulophaga sp. F20128]MCK0156502.1 cupin domain-containing protein [Cellulophaga sp. F20128]